MAYKCPKRKEKRKEKVAAESKKSEKTFASAAAFNPQTITPQLNITGNNQVSKMILCLFHAHTLNLCKPGTFQKTLIDLLSLNNLPTVVLPNDPPSQEIIENLIPAEKAAEPTINETEEGENSELEEDLELNSESENEEDQETQPPHTQNVNIVQKPTHRRTTRQQTHNPDQPAPHGNKSGKIQNNKRPPATNSSTDRKTTTANTNRPTRLQK